MAGKPAHGRRERRHAATTDEILEAAWKLARTRGLAGFSLRDLAETVQMRHQSLYTYFPSKQAIYDAMFAQGFRTLAHRRAALRLDGDPVRALRQGARAFLDFCLEDPVRYQLMFERTLPDFVPSAASMDVAAEALGYLERWLRAAGLADRTDLDLLRAMLTGLAGHQIANEPGGTRWIGLVDRAIDGLLATARRAAPEQIPRHASAVPEAAGESLAAAYQETYQAILGIISDLTDHQYSRRIPACPEWTVRDVVAHMTGVAADAVAARFPTVDPHGTWADRKAIIDAFTQGHVARRRGMTMEGVLAEWAGYVPELVRMLRREASFPAGSWPSIDWVVVSDIAAHAQDLRGAFHLPGDRESAGVVLGLKRYVIGLSQRITAAGLPTLRLCSDSRERVAGRGSPAATVTAGEWELFRVLGGRRSSSQIRALNWSGNAEPYLPLIPAYGEREDDLIE
jgi:uncharacterized protein (TIGR03083 family)